MSAASTLLMGAFRSRILDFVPTAGQSLAGTLTGGLHTHSAPDNAAFPYGTLRLVSRRTGRLDDSRLEEEGELEVFFVSRDRSRLAFIESAMDTAEQALLNWSTTAVGWLSVRGLQTRATIGPFSAPANAEVVQVRGLWRYTWWPTYRTQYAVAAGSPAP